MVEVNDSVTSQDGALKVTLTAFDPRRGEGRVKIEELQAERGRFYVTVEYGEAGQTRIDYKTYDLKKASEFPFNTNRNDAIKEIKMTGSRKSALVLAVTIMLVSLSRAGGQTVLEPLNQQVALAGELRKVHG